MSDNNLDLKKAGLKVTFPRLKILEILAQNEGHLSAEGVYKKLLESGDEVGLATVYRVLTQFETAELVVRHNFDGGHAVFEMASDEHHDHMVCVETGKVIEFFDEQIEMRQHEIAKERGYEITDHNMVLYVKPIK